MNARTCSCIAALMLAGCELNLDKSLIQEPQQPVQDASALDAPLEAEAGKDASLDGEAGKDTGNADVKPDVSKDGPGDAVAEEASADVAADTECAPFAQYGPCAVCAAAKCCPQLTTCIVDATCQTDLAEYLSCSADGGTMCMQALAASASLAAPPLVQCITLGCLECH